MSQIDWSGVESAPASNNIINMQEKMDAEAIKASIKEAERAVDLAEREVKNRKLHLHSLQKQLQDAVIAGIGGMKVGSEVELVKKPAPPKDEATRKAEVRRRWRILGMKIKFGLGAQALAVKKRNLKDADSFIDKESEVNGDIICEYYVDFLFCRRLPRRTSWTWRGSA